MENTFFRFRKGDLSLKYESLEGHSRGLDSEVLEAAIKV